MSRIRRIIDILKDLDSELQLKRELKKLPILTSKTKKVKREIANFVFEKMDGYVFSGPFINLRLKKDSILAGTPSMILGCYEKELHPVFNRIIANPPAKFIDIGAAQGYYVVGIACTTKDTKIVGFEMVDEYLNMAKSLAAYNGVQDRISWKGLCDIVELKKEVTPGTFILCDCEGAEKELLDPEKVPALINSEILVELHDFFAPGATATIIDRFRNSHTLTLINEQGRNPDDYRPLLSFKRVESQFAIAETRHISNGRVTGSCFASLIPKVLS
jgi:hypothetical protein